MRLDRVTIFGTGLIGGSLGLALKRQFPNVRICGVDSEQVLQTALKRRIIDTTEREPADLVVLATPVCNILNLLEEFRSKDTLVTDVGSTKAAICNRAEELGLQFVGGHPMAGTEASGPEAAREDLFNNKPYFLCPTQSTPKWAVDRMTGIATAIGARPIVIEPEEHDRVVARISHIPQILSTVLADYTSQHKDLAGTGLADMTRLADSPFHIWHDIFKSSSVLPDELKSFIAQLQHVLDLMQDGNIEEIGKFFKHRSQNPP